ncbi:SpoIIE family protein phosphatase [Streptomyces sp. ISL-36]|uniref:SpoIIE family protein phosphatase n=1 Tax=Streptomyces sp. ISL-36 TaxID=2819182 RepID=UPI001BE679AB|nr:SpoIIE family protein phosphatase [Streptomyces sp. ISL-36]MBT2442456.1 SpoIIE family protein phosphatase [Streptomyces sp. ISL-36]
MGRPEGTDSTGRGAAFGAPDSAVLLFDEDGVVVGRPYAAERLLGHPSSELRGRHATSLLTPDDAARVPAIAEGCAARGGWSGVLHVRHRDGRGVAVDVTVLPLPMEAGGPRWMALAVGASPSRQWTMGPALLAQMMTQLPVGLAFVDTELRCVWSNIALEHFGGGPIEQRRGRRLAEIQPGLDAELLESKMRQVLETGAPIMGYEHVGRTRADPYRDHAHAMSFIRLDDDDGRALGVCYSVVDITERYRARLRLDLMARASERIGRSLDVMGTAQDLAAVAVPGLADFVSVDLLDAVIRGAEPAPGPTAGATAVRLVRAGGLAVGGDLPETALEPGETAVYRPRSPQIDCLAHGTSWRAAQLDAATREAATPVRAPKSPPAPGHAEEPGPGDAAERPGPGDGAGEPGSDAAWGPGDGAEEVGFGDAGRDPGSDAAWGPGDGAEGAGFGDAGRDPGSDAARGPSGGAEGAGFGDAGRDPGSDVARGPGDAAEQRGPADAGGGPGPDAAGDPWPDATGDLSPPAPPGRDSRASGRSRAHTAEPVPHTAMVVPILARGVTLGVATFLRSRRDEAFDEDDLRLAEELVARAAVCLDNARRYTRERAAALVLQRSLLPHGVPPQEAVDATSFYRPADELSGLGGDWFDVVPLSGARVALVVGEVLGHGIEAAATMGQLRTAVRTLADLDLSPEELLAHLDDLVIQVTREGEEADPGGVTGPGAVGASCLYAVYDPVGLRCEIASAGHLAPAVVAPDGTVDFPDLPPGPALGIGGLPFESLELPLAEGSVLAFYTDGLIAAPGAGKEGLRRVLASRDLPLDLLCRSVVDELAPSRPYTDDAALLLVRTRRLASNHVAAWDLPADPAVVARARLMAARQLGTWGLDELAFTTELVVSELVTNAIRHATGPIRLRLILERTLICEVFDASSTSPHLRHARTNDEGGRGLFLISQFTRRWGTRYTAEGKVIWAEQPLDPADMPARNSGA